MERLLNHKSQINNQMARYGVKFGIYKDGEFLERLFPFDPIPRKITAPDYEKLEKGLIQRVTALNAFLNDIFYFPVVNDVFSISLYATVDRNCMSMYVFGISVKAMLYRQNLFKLIPFFFNYLHFSAFHQRCAQSSTIL